MIDRDALRALVAKLPPTPWEMTSYGHLGGHGIFDAAGNVVEVVHDSIKEDRGHLARFFVAAAVAVPELLAEVDQLTDEQR